MARDLERLLAEVQEARAGFEARLDDVGIAKDEYYSAVRRLNAAGMPLREIAEALGLSHQRVHQMIGETEGKKRLRRAITKAARAGGAAVICLGLAGGGWLAARTFDTDPGDGPREARDGISQTPEEGTHPSSRLPVASGEGSELRESIRLAFGDLEALAQALDEQLPKRIDPQFDFAASDAIEMLERALEAEASGLLGPETDE
ncbi:MAG: hypothetical protein ACRDLB_13135 [Actinomycetota bacterium]